jgi:nicotinamidase-related amidase
MAKNLHKNPGDARFPEGRTAVVTIDIQLDYFPGGRFPLWRAGRALKRAARLLDWARDQGLPVIHVRHSSDRAGARFLLAGTPGIALHPGLGIREGETIVDKHFPSSFHQTDLEQQLRARGITTVIWAGMITWMCVDTTVRAAKDLGFDNFVASDATAAGPLLRNAGLPGLVPPWRSQSAFLAALGAYHAQVLPVKAIIG